MLDRPVIALLARLIDREQWARERLAPFAGRRARFRLAPLPDLVIEVLDDGRIGPGGAAAEPAVTLTIPPGALPLVLARGEAALGTVQIDGDTDFARVIEFLFRNLRWDAEEDLSHVVGDAAAHRIGSAARAFGAWHRDAATRLGENVAEYLKEEAGLLVHPYELERFGREVEEVRDAVERLEQRIARLAARAPEGA
ncbi:MAG: SCP2 sterol-binding domain-containing protein [Burkholderiales bacterium]|nr:SCP2 sterol-binding domain-containing protein [Burkholderiales bacterium]